MSVDPHAQVMIAKAKDDLAVMRHLLHADVSDSAFGFHAQQAVEKACKAWLCQLGQSYPKTHDVRRLLELLARAGTPISDGEYQLADLNDFAVGARYEDWAMGLGLDRASMFASVTAFVEKVEKSFESE